VHGGDAPLPTSVRFADLAVCPRFKVEGGGNGGLQCRVLWRLPGFALVTLVTIWWTAGIIDVGVGRSHLQGTRPYWHDVHSLSGTVGVAWWLRIF
jgi:hypothetical protein